MSSDGSVRARSGGPVMRMRAALLTSLLTSLLPAGCAVGPRYHPSPVLPPSTRVAGLVEPDSTRAFFDSLATARGADSTRSPSAAAPAPKALGPESMTDLAWLDVLRDSTLTRLVETALRQNRDLALAQARIREYRAEAGVARADLWPGLTLNGSTSRSKAAFGSVAIPPYTADRATADLSWELDVWGRARRSLQAANAERAAREADERAAVLSLVSEVATGYLDLLELDQERSIADATLLSRKATLDLARHRYARGVISELDVRQFEAQMAVPAARLAQVGQLRAQQEHALNLLLGQGPLPIPRGMPLSAAARGVTVPDSVPASLLFRRPDVVSAEREYAAATARTGAAEAARLPSFFITGSYGTQSPTARDMFKKQSEIYSALGGVSFPIFTGGRLESEASAARARAEQARARYEQTFLTAVGEAGDALAGVRSAREAAVAQETQAAALRRALQLAELRYRTGVSNYLEVLEAQRSLFDAELAASQAELGQLTAAVRLYKALGGGWTAPGGTR